MSTDLRLCFTFFALSQKQKHKDLRSTKHELNDKRNSRGNCPAVASFQKSDFYLIMNRESISVFFVNRKFGFLT